MTAPPTRDRPTSFQQTVDVETPELVVLSYAIAGVGSRIYAAIIDLFVCFVALLGVIFVSAMVSAKWGNANGPPKSRSEIWFVAIYVLAQFAVTWGYYVLFEGLADGQTIGKRALRLRVVRDGGYSVGFAASAVRNLMRVVDMFFVGLVGIVSILVTKHGKRIGDLVAGTMVVREELVDTPSAARRATAPRASTGKIVAAPTAAALTDAQFRVLERWYDRRQEFDAQRRAALTDQLAAQLAHALPVDESPVAARLIRLYESEKLARVRGIAARAEVGAGRERYAIVATQSPRWIAFAHKLSNAQSEGLSSLGERGVREFVAEYRALSADLARLRTAARGVYSDELFYLGRLVSTAHNLIYRDRKSDLLDAVFFFTRDIPRELRRSWRPILVAAVLLFGPMAIAHIAVVRDPSVAPTFLPKGMLDRAEAGIKRAEQGIGYIDDPQIFRPIMATEIVAHNVQVTIAVFAMGITLGLGSAIMLLQNGVGIGGVFGLYQSKGIGSLLVAFVAPHGVLELSAICIAGGGAFLISAAVILPGRRTRRRALAENSMRAIKLMGAATLLLLVAGSLEGLVSPIPYWPLSLKLCVSAFTAVLLYLYVRLGAGRDVTADRGLLLPDIDSPPTSQSESEQRRGPSLPPDASAPAPRSVLGLAPPLPR